MGTTNGRYKRPSGRGGAEVKKWQGRRRSFPWPRHTQRLLYCNDQIIRPAKHENTLAGISGSHAIQCISQKCTWIIFEGVLTAQSASDNAEGFDSQHLPSSLHSVDKTESRRNIDYSKYYLCFDTR